MPRRLPPDRAERLERRFRAELDALGLRGRGRRVLVALSGGRDSVTLLHLLRFHAGEGAPELAAAHFDHALRRGSAADARWVRGLCAAWRVPLVEGRAEEPPRGEEAARDARYAFLREAMEEAGADRLATAHHADDQAETVLFRVLRGTGLHGLAGIAPDDGRGLVRPLLPFWRSELRAYARTRGLRWRTDPTNRLPGATRNRIRRLLPRMERAVAPGARRALVRLAALAREEEGAWEGLLAAAEAEAAREEEGSLVLVREALRAYDAPVAARLVRRLLRRRGIALDRAGTRSALQFITAAPSGRELHLPGGARLRTEFGAARLVPGGATAESPPDRPLRVPSPGEGEGTAWIGGRSLAVRWWTGPAGGPPEGEGRAALRVDALRFPLAVRGRRPGDRLRTLAGTRPLKKLLGEARVPRWARDGVPVVADADGAVVWAAGVATSAPAEARPGDAALFLQIDMMANSETTLALTGGKPLSRIVYTADQIAARVREMGREITEQIPEGEDLLVLGLLKGSFIFLSDLVREIRRPLQVDFLVASSYGDRTSTSGEVRLLYDSEAEIRDRHVVLVEDIVDSGTTLSRLIPLLEAREPRSLEVCALLHKHIAADLAREPRWVGFDAPNEFLIGYGLDHSEKYRNLPFIGSL